MARRDGAEVVLVYRRSREEMPAIEAETEDARLEGVSFELLAAPTQIIRDGEQVCAIEIQRMALGEPDASGRRRPVPIEGDLQRLEVDSVIVAVSQVPDLSPSAGLPDNHGWLETGEDGRIEAGLWAGGDDRGLGIASLAVSHGRHAAEAAHAELRGLPAPTSRLPTTAARRDVKPDFYEGHMATTPPRRPQDAWLTEPDSEITETLTPEEAAYEARARILLRLSFGCLRGMWQVHRGLPDRFPEPTSKDSLSPSLDHTPAGRLAVAAVASSGPRLSGPVRTACAQSTGPAPRAAGRDPPRCPRDRR